MGLLHATACGSGANVKPSLQGTTAPVSHRSIPNILKPRRLPVEALMLEPEKRGASTVDELERMLVAESCMWHTEMNSELTLRFRACCATSNPKLRCQPQLVLSLSRCRIRDLSQIKIHS